MRPFAVLLLAVVPVCAAAGADDGGPAAVPPGIGITVRAQAVGRTHDCSPFYSRASLRDGETGAVAVHYDVAADGTIGNVVLVQRSGFAKLDDAAFRCVTQQWRETPAMAGTTPVATAGHLGVITFDIDTNSKAIEFLIKGMGLAVTAKTGADLQAAIGDFDKALEIDPNYANAYYERGVAYLRLGDTARAEADFAKAGHSLDDGTTAPSTPPPTNMEKSPIGSSH